MTSGTEQVVIRKATVTDLDVIKRIADGHKHELGFIVRSALQFSISKQEVLVAIANPDIVCGFVQYRHRKDTQTTLYNIVVNSPWRRRGIGRQLIDALITESTSIGKHCLLLRCPSDLSANQFYAKCDFVLDHTNIGKQRQLNVWIRVLAPFPRCDT